MKYNKEYYEEVWNRVLSKYTIDSQVRDLGDISRQYYLHYFLKKYFDNISEKESIRIIDMGCGNWLYLNVIIKSVKEYCKRIEKRIPVEIIGIDYSHQAMEFGVKKYRKLLSSNITITLIENDIMEAIDNFDKEKYDLLLSLETLEHLYYDATLLGKSRRLLNKDGRFILSVPNATPFFLSKNWFLYVFFKKKFSEKDIQVGHLRRYRISDIYALIKENNFLIEETKCYGFLLSDYLKQVMTISERSIIKEKIFVLCKKILLLENDFFNKINMCCSEGIFVCMKGK